MSSTAPLASVVTGLAFVLGIVFGAVGNRSSFCTMGAITDFVAFGDSRRLRMWALAIAVAIAGTAMLSQAGLVDLSKSIYTSAKVNWLSLTFGGFLFGFGMTLGSGCGSKTLIRLGAGNLKSLIVIILLGVSAYMTLKGLFAVFRVNALDRAYLDLSRFGAASSDLPTLMAAAGATASVRTAAPFVVAAVIAGIALASSDFRATREMVVGGIIVGALIVAGWYVSGHMGYMPEDPATLEPRFVATNTGRPESLSFVGPVAYLLELLLFWTDTSRMVTFGIAGVLGMIVGSAGVAMASRTFRWEGFASIEDLGNHVVGGILMGFGGVCALGCTVGQGLSGVSTLAVGSFLALAAIGAGCVAAVRYQLWRLADVV